MTEKDVILADVHEPNFFFLIPNMVDDLLADPYEFRLYAHYRKVCGAGGACWESTTTSAKACGMSPRKLTSVRDALAGRGLITIQKSRRKDGGDDTLKIRIVNIWAANNEYYWNLNPAKYHTQLTGGDAPNAGGGMHQMRGGDAPNADKKESFEKDSFVDSNESTSAPQSSSDSKLLTPLPKPPGHREPQAPPPDNPAPKPKRERKPKDPSEKQLADARLYEIAKAFISYLDLGPDDIAIARRQMDSISKELEWLTPELAQKFVLWWSSQPGERQAYRPTTQSRLALNLGQWRKAGYPSEYEDVDSPPPTLPPAELFS